MKRIAGGGLLATALLLVMAPAVLAWPDDATVQLSSTPGGTFAGQHWDVDVSFVSQGRQMTVDSLTPSILIHDASGGRELAFPAEPTGRAGIYRATVVFPTEGDWSYTVLADSYGTSFSFPAVHIAAAPGAAPATPAPVALPSVPMLLMLAVLAVAMMGLGRYQRRQLARG